MKVLVTSLFFIALSCFLFTNLTMGQNSTDRVQPALPAVFILGEHDKLYEEVMPGYESLLDACNGDMKVAFDKLMIMMQEMEAFANLSDYDLKGIHAWMHFFFRKDGSIEHIGFYLKPNSKNVDTDKLKNFLGGFARQYKFPLSWSKKFSHYSSFSFPVVYNRTIDNNKSTVRKGGDGR